MAARCLLITLGRAEAARKSVNLFEISSFFFAALQSSKSLAVPMESSTTPQPVCAMEALNVLNCTIESPFDREKCILFLDALRNCVIEKKVRKFHWVDRAMERKFQKARTSFECH